MVVTRLVYEVTRSLGDLESTAASFSFNRSRGNMVMLGFIGTGFPVLRPRHTVEDD